MLSGDKGLSNSTLLDPAAVLKYVTNYLTLPETLPKQAVANFNKILPALESSPHLSEIYSHPHSLKLLCNAMYSSHPDSHLLDAHNNPALLQSLWFILLKHFSLHHWPMRANYNGVFLDSYVVDLEKVDASKANFSHEQLSTWFSDEHLLLGYFAFTLLQKNTNQATLDEAITWISKRTKLVAQSTNFTMLGDRKAMNQEDILHHLLNLQVFTRHPGSTQYSFYNEQFKYFFAAHFMVTCMMRTTNEDLINDALTTSVRQFIIDNHDNTFLDELWFHVYSAFPLFTGAHARAEFNKLTITTRAECMTYLSSIFKLTERELPEKYLFQLTLNGSNQFIIRSPKSRANLNHHIFDFFNNIYIHFDNKDKCKLISTSDTCELIFTSKSAQEIQNIAFAFTKALGKRGYLTPSPNNLFAGDVSGSNESYEKQELSVGKH